MIRIYSVCVEVICPTKCNTKFYDYVCPFIGTGMYLGEIPLIINIPYLYVHVQPYVGSTDFIPFTLVYAIPFAK